MMRKMNENWMYTWEEWSEYFGRSENYFGAKFRPKATNSL